MGRDLRVALRALVKAPWFALATILVLAVATGLNAVVFSLVYATLLQPLPYRDAARLVTIVELESGRRTVPLTPFDFDTVRRSTSSFSGFTGYRYNDLELSEVTPPQRVTALHVLDGFFAFLGVAPELGRYFSSDDFYTASRLEEGLFSVADVAVLGHGFWLRQFGASMDIIGTRIHLNDRSVVVVGVMPDGFDALFRDADLYVPWIVPPGFWAVRPPHVLPMLARLRPEVGIEEARAELTTIYSRLRDAYPETNEVLTADVEPLRQMLSGVSRPLLVLLGGAMVVLLLACTNLSGLMAIRAKSRFKEVAVRRALGARGRDIARGLLMEASVLAGLGGLAGLVVARLSLPWVELPAIVPFAPEVGMPVFFFTFVLSATAILFIGVTPAWLASSTELVSALRGNASDASSRRVASSLVVVQVGLALSLVATGGLLLRSLASMRDEGLGFRTDRLLSFYVSLPSSRYPEDEDQRELRRQALEAFRRLPGVLAAESASHLPATPMVLNLATAIEGRPRPRGSLRAAPVFVSHGLLETLGIAVVEGRSFTDDDSRSSPWVIVVNETMARTFWPEEDAVGQRIRFEYDWAPDAPVSVIGVTRDVRQEGVGTLIRPAFYILHEQFPQDFLYFVLRTQGDPESVTASAREQLRAVDKNLPMADVRSMAVRLDDALAVHRSRQQIVSIYAIGALILATLGVYGVLASIVSSRARELVIRMTLGASGRDIIRLIMRRALWELGLGLALGLVLATASGRLVESFLYGVEPTDPTNLAVTSVVLAGCGILASAIPAWRASRLQPSQRLRQD